MTITMNRNELVKALSACKFPKGYRITEHLRITAGYRLYIDATDGLDFVQMSVEYKGDKHEPFCIKASELFEAVGASIADTCEIEINTDNTATFRSGDETSGVYQQMMDTLDADTLPEFPKTPCRKDARMTAGQLREMFNAVSYASDPKNTRPVMARMLLQTKNNKLHAVCTNTHIMAHYEIPCETEAVLDGSVDVKSFKRVIDFIKQGSVTQETSVWQSEDGKFIGVMVLGGQFLMALPDMQFPSYERIEPRNNGRHTIEAIAVCEVKGLLDVLARVKPISAKWGGRIQVSSGYGSEFVVYAHEGVKRSLRVHAGKFIEGEIELLMSVDYLINILKTFPTNYARFEFSAPLRPFSIAPCNDQGEAIDDLYVVQMPMAAND